MEKNKASVSDNGQKQAKIPTASEVFDDGTLLEMVYDPDNKRTSFVVWKEGQWKIEREHVVGNQRLVPYSSNNNLIKNHVLLFPSTPEEYGTEDDLIKEIRTFIHRYVDVSPGFEKIASYYVLFSWVYDSFNELPYLRLRGDYGSGKTRFLLTMGSLCYKPIFVSHTFICCRADKSVRNRNGINTDRRKQRQFGHSLPFLFLCVIRHYYQMLIDACPA